ncbi:MAG: hypothetical protein HOW59_29820 [Nonomuraea sp.]|nr:hypothetical protein [Nonomuraea sp.]
MTGIEERLRDALAVRAEAVRDDGRPQVLPAPRVRSSAVRLWGPAAMVAAVVVLVVVVTVAGARTVGAPAPALLKPAVTGAMAAPIATVWPAAVHQIPDKAPGGRTFLPDAITGGALVVGRGLTRNRPDGIWSYDLRKRAFAQIAPLKDVRVANAPVVAGDGYVAWSAHRAGKVEVWAVPLAGGAPRRLASVTAALSSENSTEGIDLAIADGTAVWSPSDGGVYRVPLRGGKAVRVPGTLGYHLVSWPWAGSPQDGRRTDIPVRRPMEQLKNVLTGEVREARPPAGHTSWRACAVTWCHDGRQAWKRDGTALRTLPGDATGPLYAGHVVLITQRDRGGRAASVVHEVATGRTGLLFPVPTRTGDPAPPTLFAHEALFRYRSGDHTQTVIDLRAIS